MDGNGFILLPILIPIIAGVLFPWLKCLKTRKSRMCYIGCTLIISAVAVVSVLAATWEENSTFVVWNLTDALPIYFHIDGISVVFAALTTFVFVGVGFYSFEYMKHEKEEERFFSFYLIVLGVLLGLDFSGNLITMYLFFELMTLTTLPLVLHERTKESLAAGIKYLFYSIGGAFLGLLGIFFIYRYSTSLQFTAGGVLDLEKLAGNESIFLVIVFLTIIGFGCKAGMFPMHSWLPAAHPVAPSPASAVLSGIITKAGVLAILRFVYYIVGAEFLRGTWVQTAWIVLTLVTVFMGSMLAYKEPLLKRRLAYSTVSQVSYILFGLSLLNPLGILGALLHVIFHSLIKNTLFMSAGAIIVETRHRRVEELEGIGKRMPVTIWCFTLVGIALVGIPPTSGFVSKWYLAMGAFSGTNEVIQWLGPVVLLVSALLTAGYLLPVTMKGFLPGKEHPQKEKIRTSAFMLVPMIVFTAGAVLLGVFSKPVCNYLTKLIATLI